MPKKRREIPHNEFLDQTSHFGAAVGARLRLGEYLLDRERHGVFLGAERVALTPTPFRVLLFLIENQGRVVSKDELLDRVWRAKREKDTVEHAITSIRRALRDDKDNPRFVETVQGVGYSFIAPVIAEAPAPQLDPAAQSAAVAPMPSRRALLVVTGTTIGVGALGLAGYRFRSSRAIESLAVEGQTLTAQDGRGAAVWTHHFTRALTPLDAGQIRRRLQTVRWLKDEAPGVLFAASHPTAPGSAIGDDVLYCFSASGRLAWSLPLRLDLIDAYGAPFEAGWALSDLLVSGGETRPARVWASIVHHLRFASGVIAVNAHGEASLRFANAGHVQRLCGIAVQGENLIVAGGVNNVVDRNCVAVFGEDDAPAMSPDMNSAHYHYRNEPARPPRVYAILPASEYYALIRLTYGNVALLYEGDGSILMRPSSGPCFPYSFEFAPDLRPRRVFRDGGEAANHRELERQGLVSHDYASCPERQRRLTMKRWDPTQGWSELVIPWSGQDG